MTLRIDRAGRIVVPKPIRDRLGLQPGSALELEETPDGLRIRAQEHAASLTKKDGFLVYTGELPPGFDVLHAIERDREDRIRKMRGT